MSGQRLNASVCDEHAVALAKIDAFLHSDERLFVVHGLAGTGKTHLLCQVAERYPDGVLCTPTNKAAQVITDRAERPACTLHSLIYSVEGEAKDARGRAYPVFREKPFYGRLVLLDECSMVGTKPAENLLNKCHKIIAFGDPGQLPPVEGEPYFTKPDFRLTQNHRQAGGSGVMRQAWGIRKGSGKYEQDGEDFHVLPEPPNDRLIKRASIILCWANHTRREFNNRARQLRGFDRRLLPQPGERLVVREQPFKKNTFKGQTLTTVSCTPIEGHYKLVTEETGDAPIYALIEGFDDYQNAEGGDPRTKRGRTFLNCVAFGYASTVHGAQGSQYERVLVIDEMPKWRDEYRAWLYTAVTRATAKVAVWKPQAEGQPW